MRLEHREYDGSLILTLSVETLKTQFSALMKTARLSIQLFLLTHNKILSELLDKRAPETTTTRRLRKSDVWFDNDCRQMKKEMRRCEKRYKLGRPRSFARFR